MTAFGFGGEIKIGIFSVFCCKNDGQNMKRRQTSPWQRIIEKLMISAMRLFEKSMKIRRQKMRFSLKGKRIFGEFYRVKYFSLMISTGISLPVQRVKAAAP